MLLPNSEKRIYNLQSKQLIKLFSQVKYYYFEYIFDPCLSRLGFGFLNYFTGTYLNSLIISRPCSYSALKTLIVLAIKDKVNFKITKNSNFYYDNILCLQSVIVVYDICEFFRDS